MKIPSTVGRVLRVLWALPLTLPGVTLLAIALATGGRWHRLPGALAVSGGWPAWWLRAGRLRRYPVLAISCGHIIIGRDEPSLNRAARHELAHVRQGERWGILFPIAYVAAGVVAMVRGGRYYDDNQFEIEARAAESCQPE
jgi:hypothetical protein